MSDLDLNMLLAMKHSPVRNYVVPGLTSWLIGAPSEKGCIRLFECEREHQEAVIPHSHRFDFQCWVLEGSVRNRIWTKTWGGPGDWYVSTIHRKGRLGGYEADEESRHKDRWAYRDTVYGSHEWYSMKHHEIHSIYFGRDAKVLFFEGAEKTDATTILEPVANGERVPTFKVEPWMFVREVSPLQSGGES